MAPPSVRVVESAIGKSSDLCCSPEGEFVSLSGVLVQVAAIERCRLVPPRGYGGWRDGSEVKKKAKRSHGFESRFQLGSLTVLEPRKSLLGEVHFLAFVSALRPGLT